MCNFCEYQTTRRWHLRSHLTNKHALPLMQNIHKFGDTQEAGTQEADEFMGPTFQKADVLKLMDECFDVFQIYMKIKMQRTDFKIEEMIEEVIEECIDVSKYAMKQKISEQ